MASLLEYGSTSFLRDSAWVVDSLRICAWENELILYFLIATLAGHQIPGWKWFSFSVLKCSWLHCLPASRVAIEKHEVISDPLCASCFRLSGSSQEPWFVPSNLRLQGDLPWCWSLFIHYAVPLVRPFWKLSFSSGKFYWTIHYDFCFLVFWPSRTPLHLHISPHGVILQFSYFFYFLIPFTFCSAFWEMPSILQSVF